MAEIISEPKVCANCGMAIPPDSKTCPKCGAKKTEKLTAPPLPTKPETKIEPPPALKTNPFPLILIILLLCSSLLMLSSSVVNVVRFSAPNAAKIPAPAAAKIAPPKKVVAPAPTDLKFQAYLAAKKFVSEQFPDAQKFSEYKESPIDQSGKNYSVLIFFDALNQTSPPARNVFTVEMEWSGTSFKLKQIKR
ncbi:MAG: zinc ribbon domain-containing protein [Verrucomicrobiota bacterium]|nr:zinc ribbon domain-containing protein [Verrucomicrobiota bacterium]